MGSLPPVIQPFRVLIVGCSYAGLSTAVNLLDLTNGRSPRMSSTPYDHLRDLTHIPVEISIVDEKDGFYHVIGSPLALASSDYAAKAWVKFPDIIALQRPNVKFIQGSVDKVDSAAKTATIIDHVTKLRQTQHYDFLVAASGLRRVWPVVPQSLTRKQYLFEAEEHIRSVSNATDGVVIVGGGAVGIEMAAELKMVHPTVKVTLVHSRDKLLSSEGLSDECKDKALELTRQMNVEVLLNHRVAETRKLESAAGNPKFEVEFTNGTKMVASQVIMAISRSIPSTTYLPESAVDDEGYVKISSNLIFASNIPNAADHLAIGDIALWSGIKRCGAAMHHGHYAAINIHQLMLAKLDGPAHKPRFMELQHVPPMIGLAVGRNAVACGPEGTSSGEDVMRAYFRDDLGFAICWEYMQLSKGEDTKAEEGLAQE